MQLPVSPLSRLVSIVSFISTYISLYSPVLAQDASLRGVPAAISQDVLQMKKKRQCSLEWEFLATILDRLFLILFIVIVLLVTLGMTLTGRMAQLHYDVYNAES